MKLEPDFSQACSFCRMLMNHKNFHFTQIPDKTNNVIFLKSPKAMFLGHFLTIFALWGFFPKKIRLSHATIYGPLTSCKISKKNKNKKNELISRKLMNRRKGGQKEGQTDPILQDPSGRGWGEYTKSCFKKNSERFSTNSTTQENITILRLK